MSSLEQQKQKLSREINTVKANYERKVWEIEAVQGTLKKPALDNMVMNMLRQHDKKLQEEKAVLQQKLTQKQQELEALNKPVEEPVVEAASTEN